MKEAIKKINSYNSIVRSDERWTEKEIKNISTYFIIVKVQGWYYISHKK
ncbi:MAG: hypothetical protein ACD_63C00117G0002 [uncultured bacterium]|nr:MAG: hypothetical protein ACD_63C00117G0002 [uncultured bacterium]